MDKAVTRDSVVIPLNNQVIPVIAGCLDIAGFAGYQGTRVIAVLGYLGILDTAA